jgi:hypothetical protein
MVTHHRRLLCLLSSRNLLDQVRDLLALCSSPGDHLSLGLSLRLGNNLI